MIKVKISKKEAKHGCKKKVKIPGTGKSVILNIPQGEKGNRVISVPGSQLGLSNAVDLFLTVKKFNPIIAVVAGLFLIGCISLSIQSSTSNKTTNYNYSQEINNIQSSDNNDNQPEETNINTTDINNYYNIKVGKTIKEKDFSSKIVGKWISLDNGVVDFFSNGTLYIDEDHGPFRYNIDGNTLSMEEPYGHHDFYSAISTISLTDATLTITNKDFETDTFYRLDGNKYKPKEVCPVSVFEDALRGTIDEYVVLNTFETSDGLTYQKSRVTSRAFTDIGERYDNPDPYYDVWCDEYICVFSGAVGRWFYKDSDAKIYHYYDFMLDNTTLTCDVATINVEVMDCINKRITCSWNIDGDTGSGTYEMMDVGDGFLIILLDRPNYRLSCSYDAGIKLIGDKHRKLTAIR